MIADESFCAVRNMLQDELSHVTGESITATLAADFGLECNLEETFGMNCEKLSKEDVAQMLNIDLTPK